MSDQLDAGATSETALTWKTIHTSHSPIHSKKANVKGWLWRLNYIRGPYGPKASWHSSYRWGKTPKNLTQETCPDRGSNPGPLRDKRACYHLGFSFYSHPFYPQVTEFVPYYVLIEAMLFQTKEWLLMKGFLMLRPLPVTVCHDGGRMGVILALWEGAFPQYTFLFSEKNTL